MPNYGFRLSGKLMIELPVAATPASGDAAVKIDIFEEMELSSYEVASVTLEDDPPETVGFGDLPSAGFVLLRVKTLGAGTVLARLTHADGTLQVVPVGPIFMVGSLGSPITAITLQRATGVASVVQVLLCQQAP